jgi:hypothetical protein
VLSVGAQDVPVTGERRSPPSLSLRDFDARFKSFLLVVVVFTL